MGEMPVKISWQRLRQMILHREGGGRGRGKTEGRGASRFRSLTSRPLIRLPSIILSGERQKERQQEISSAYFSWQQRKQHRG